jgi:hypothetical protein
MAYMRWRVQHQRGGPRFAWAATRLLGWQEMQKRVEDLAIKITVLYSTIQVDVREDDRFYINTTLP